MGGNLEKDAVEMAAKNRRILENGFRIFAEKGIEKATMNDAAKAAGIAVSPLYRDYSITPRLVMAIVIRAWSDYDEANARQAARLERRGGREEQAACPRRPRRCARSSWRDRRGWRREQRLMTCGWATHR